MPKSKLRKNRRKSLLRKQIVMTAPSKLFVELYFTKSALRIKEEMKGVKMKKAAKIKFLAQTAPKNRYRVNQDAMPFVPKDKVKARVIMHL